MKDTPKMQVQVLQLARENAEFAALLGRYLLAVEDARITNGPAWFNAGDYIEWINEKKVYDWNADDDEFDIDEVEWFSGTGFYYTTDMGDDPVRIDHNMPLSEFTEYGAFKNLVYNYLE